MGPGLTGPGPDHDPGREAGRALRHAEFAGLLEDSPEDLYENAPCGYISTLLDGQIARVNGTLLRWLGRSRAEVVGVLSFTDLLTVGGRIFHETHFAPKLRVEGHIGGIALELRAADGTRMPVLVSSTVKSGSDGSPLLIRTTVFDATDRRSYEEELLRARREAEGAWEDIERERAGLHLLARALQDALLPPVLPRVPGVEAAAHYHPARPGEVRADFYDLFPLPDGRWGFFMGDVPGTGPDAARLAAVASRALRDALVEAPDPGYALAALNSVLVSDGTRMTAVVAGVLVPDGTSAAVTLASGGHPPALLLRADGAVSYVDTRGGEIAGALPRARFQAARCVLHPGDTLLLYTDGLLEAHGATADDPYGDRDLLDFAALLAPTSPRGIVHALADLLTGLGEEAADDTALLALGLPLG